MRNFQHPMQRVFAECLRAMLGPIVQLTLKCGLGYSEFAAVAKRTFVEEATLSYGVRGRPANASKIAAKTGLNRKVVAAFRHEVQRAEWSPDNEANPINTIIHYWRYDTKYCVFPGTPKTLQYEGPSGFIELVSAYAGDIPPSTIRQELVREGIARILESGDLELCKNYSFPEAFDEDFLRNASFSMRSLGATLLHNAELLEEGAVTEADHVSKGWFERVAWSRRIRRKEIEQLQHWVRVEGEEFIQRADALISEHEDIENEASDGNSDITGVGIYFFGR